MIIRAVLNVRKSMFFCFHLMCKVRGNSVKRLSEVSISIQDCDAYKFDFVLRMTICRKMSLGNIHWIWEKAGARDIITDDVSNNFLAIIQCAFMIKGHLLCVA